MSARMLFLLGIALPRIAPACAVCFSGTDESRSAYVFTTVLLSVLPLLSLAGFFGWARWRTRALAREVAQRQAASALLAPRD